MVSLPVPAAPADLVPLGAALDSARGYAQASKADRTQAAYRQAFGAFRVWAAERGADPLPAREEVVAAYFADMADRGRAAATIDLHAAAIAFAHRAGGHEPPTNHEAVKATIRGIRRRIGTKPARKAPATAEAIKRMLRRIPDDLRGKRDRALLLVGFAAALRRSELVALHVEHLERAVDGVFVQIPRSKTDQEGAGHVVAVPRGSKLRPCEALDDWLAASGIVAGPVFRAVARGGRVAPGALSDRAVADIVKERAEAAGLDPDLFAGHSLRAGFVTSALAAGADLLKVMDVTRHTQVETLKAYDRRAKAFKNHAGRGFL